MSTFTFTCATCNHQMSLPLSVVGRKGKCPSCGTVNLITAPSSTPPLQQPPLQQPPVSNFSSHSLETQHGGTDPTSDIVTSPKRSKWKLWSLICATPLALFFILFFTVANNKAASTPEEFARSVVELLATSDSEELLEFIFPSKEQLRDFAITEIKSVPEDRIEEFLEKLDEIYAEQKQEVLDSLERLRSDAASSGCHLENASFVKCKHEDVSLENDIFVTITESGKNYRFLLGDCSLINGRWYNISGVSGFQGQR